MLCTPAVRNHIRDEKTFQIQTDMQVGKKFGMMTLDDSIEKLLQKKRISPEDAYINCIEKERFAKFLRRPPTGFMAF